MILDLTDNSKITETYRTQLDRLASELEEDYTRYVDCLSMAQDWGIDWWTLNLPSRNPTESPHFSNCCLLELAKSQILGEKNTTEVLVHSEGFKRVLEAFCFKEGVRIEITVKRLPCSAFRPFFRAFQTVFASVIIALVAKILKDSIEGLRPDKPKILIDTFFLPGQSSIDKYYTGLWQNAGPEISSSLYFIPTFLSNSIIGYLFSRKKLEALDPQCLFKEDFLKWKDYWYALRHYWRVRMLPIPKATLRNLDLTDLVREELRSVDNFPTAYRASQNFRFFFRLKESGIKVKRSINWFENQPLDKAWNAGVREFYPDADSCGYMGYTNLANAYMNLFPTRYEKESGVIPDTLYVIGRGFVPTLKRFCGSLDVEVAPAFRFGNVRSRVARRKNTDEFVVLIATAMEVDQVLTLLEEVALWRHENPNEEIKIFLKLHPALREKRLSTKISKKLYRCFQIKQESLETLTLSADLVIGEGTSNVCLESVMRGVPAIVSNVGSKIAFNPMPPSVPDHLFRLCRTGPELIRAIRFFKNVASVSDPRYDSDTLKTLSEQFFETATTRGTRKFLTGRAS